VNLLPRPQILPYQDVQDDRIRGLAAAGYGHLSLAAMPWRLKEGEAENGFAALKHSSTRRVLSFTENVFAAAPVELFAKRNLSRGAMRREWKIGWALVQRGILTGRPVVVAEKRVRGLVQENYLITERIAADQPLLLHLREHVKESGEDPSALLRALATFIRQLHALGFYHDDLSAEHLWVANAAKEPHFGVIDLDQALFKKRVSERGQLMNLFQILRSIPNRHLAAEHRRLLLTEFYGARWPREERRVTAQLHALSARKAERDVL
jgi:tRNA A-37 threonylcarbamoyl transferase component Bud32